MTLSPGALFIAFAHGDDVDVGARAVFDEHRVLRRGDVHLHGEVGVDDGCVNVVEGARDLGGFDFLELDVFLVLCDVAHRGLFTDAFLELDDAGFFEEQEGAAAVRRGVRDGNRRAVYAVFLPLSGCSGEKIMAYGGSAG